MSTAGEEERLLNIVLNENYQQLDISKFTRMKHLLDEVAEWFDLQPVRKRIRLLDADDNVRHELEDIAPEYFLPPAKGGKYLTVNVSPTEPFKDSIQRNIDAAAKLGSHKAPSTAAEPTVFFTDKMNTDYLVHRPSPVSTSIPLTLMHPIFGQFVDNQLAAALDNADCEAALQFMFLMSMNYKTEDMRRESLNLFWNRYMELNGALMPYSYNESKRQMDGGVKVNGIWALVEEIKNELCDSKSCPYLQHILYYGQSLPKLYELHLRTRFPAFGLYISGCFIGITGLLFCQGKVICEPLTEFIPCLYLPQNRPHWEKVARMLKSLKIGVHLLMEHAAQSADLTKPPIDVSTSCVYPYLAKINDKPLVYLNRAYDKKLIFVVQMDQDQYVLKFTRTYSFDAHEACADSGFAPRIYAKGTLAGGWIYILMELVRDLVDADDIQDDNERQQVVTLMRQAVNRLHSSGYVHGDFRPNNVMVQRIDQGFRLVVLDFDHSGRINEARYPSFLNMGEIDWPSGVHCHALIQPAHDLYFVEKYANVTSV